MNCQTKDERYLSMMDFINSFIAESRFTKIFNLFSSEYVWTSSTPLSRHLCISMLVHYSSVLLPPPLVLPTINQAHHFVPYHTHLKNSIMD